MNGVTLLICTHNGAARLPDTLRHVAAQQVPAGVPWEVLIVSNASKDNTVEAATTLGRELPVPCRVLDEPVAGKENALIRGFNEARYEFIVIVDDDNWLAPNYVGLVFEIMSAHPEIGILGAHAEGAFEITPPKWFEEFRAVYAVGPQNNGKSGPLPDHEGYLYGAGSVVRKSGWLKLLDHDFRFTTSTKRGKIIVSGEDVELGDALQLAGYKLWYDDRLRLKHFMFKERLTWHYLMRIGQGTASSQLTSIVYYFVFRHPNLTEARFRQLYTKRLAWLASQIAKQPANVYNAVFRRDREELTSNFETMRLLYNFKTSLAQREEAVRVFRQVRTLQDRLAQTAGAGKAAVR
ncbi:glycosyltransferase family 2 protein [Hymenobacter sp. BT175]|uniref:glycosyltransferase n=1 Tax=Hymenobacter translucens TaxID=2886507 RepID=UPI001D0E66C4|nr:glycosyltransferase [Hymenobacter translucens]MCC2547909.1 glycosyltransferase family 2 protein [Hymenobacter translucens]